MYQRFDSQNIKLRSDVNAAFVGSKQQFKLSSHTFDKVNSVLSKKKRHLSIQSQTINTLPVFLPDEQLIYS